MWKIISFGTLLSLICWAKAVDPSLPVHLSPAVISQAVLTPSAVSVARVVQPEPVDSHLQYVFGYAVADSISGDNKAHKEVREGGIVKGSYSLIDPDGVRRTVNYYADPVHGFNAVVHRTPPKLAKII